VKLRHLIVSVPHPLFNPTTTNYGTSLYPRYPVRLRLRFPHGTVFRTTRRILSEIHVARPGADRPDGQSRAVGCGLPFGTTSEALRVGGHRRADGPAMAGISAKRFARQSRRMQPDYRRGGSSGGDETVRGAFFAPELFRLFIERCDLLVFQEHHAGAQMVGLLRELLTDMAVPLPVQYELLHPGYASLHYPADRKQYRIYGGPYYDPYQEIRQSVAYLRRNNFVIRAEHLPMIFVHTWQSEPPPGWYHYLTTPDDTDAIFRLRETPRHDHLSLKVFAYAYAVRHDMWAGGRATPSGADAIRRFRQFRQLLEMIAARREAGERVKSFDLMDFDGYDKLLKQYGWVQRPDEMNTRLCDE
jgi:hypothetical protein